jgi:hypothetical protein
MTGKPKRGNGTDIPDVTRERLEKILDRLWAADSRKAAEIIAAFPDGPLREYLWKCWKNRRVIL